jgi:hypothetical protein
MMIARAKIESQNLGTRALPVGLLDAAAQNPSTVNSGDDLRPQPVEMDGLPSAFIEKQADAWKISNPNSGGIFDVEWKRGGGSTLRVTPQSKLECDVQIPPEARIDAYLTIGGVRYCVEISGGQRADARVKKLGTATLENSTGNWKSVSFPLGDALKKLFPNDANWTIEKLEFGALHGDEYRWAGFFGNALGASYEVKNLRF